MEGPMGIPWRVWGQSIHRIGSCPSDNITQGSQKLNGASHRKSLEAGIANQSRVPAPWREASTNQPTGSCVWASHEGHTWKEELCSLPKTPKNQIKIHRKSSLSPEGGPGWSPRSLPLVPETHVV